jgi:RHS repeat-associated protein
MGYARNPSLIPGRIRCPTQSLKSYNRSHMQPAPSTRVQDGFMAAMRLGGEKPHQGVRSQNPAPNQVREVCNFTVLLGLQAAAVLNRVGSCSPGKERDTESGNDYFGARYYASSMGRFMSPDWSAKYEPVPYAKLDNPQSLNLYGYVLNNPLSHADPDGHQCDTCQKVWSWLTSSHSASASASAAVAQGSSTSGPLSVTAKLGTAQAGASASYGTNTSVSAKAGVSGTATTINEGTHSTTQVDSLTANASANAGVGLGGKAGVGISAGAGANADVLSASQTETLKIGPVTITGTATGNVGLGANASFSLGTGGISASAGLTPGYGGALSLGVSWGGDTISGGASVKGTMDTTTTKINQPEVKPN